MATLATETWTGTTGAAWPAQWTTGTSGGAININANRGLLSSAAAAYTPGAKGYLNGITAARDLDITIDVAFLTPASEQYLFIGIRSTDAAAGSTPSAMYYAQIQPHVSAINVGKYVASAETDISGTDLATGAWTASTAKRIRFQAIANTIRVKVWETASAEPGTWGLTITDTSLSAATGKVFLTLGSGGDGVSRTAYFDNMTVTDGVDTAPSVTVAAGLSGSGTLTATTTPLATRTGALSGSGTATVTVTPKLTVAAAGSGAGTLTASPVVLATRSVALSGSGSLSALTADVVSISISVAFDGDGELSATAYPVHFSFIPPNVAIPYHIKGRGLFGAQPYGITVWRANGVWHQSVSPEPGDADGYDRLYEGGRIHIISSSERDDLIAAGFEDYITEDQ